MTLAIELQQVSKRYDNGLVALNNVSLQVQQGDFFALLGPNGAGKSTLIGILCSLALKSQGQVSILGIDIDKNFARAKQMIGVVPQEFNFSQFEKVIDIVVTQAGFYGIKRELAEQRAEKYLRRLDLWEKRNEIARFLSGGMKRRLMIVRALIHEPKLLVLDEPTAGVDIELRRSMWDFLKEINAQGTTIILTTHYLEEAESLCRNIAIIDQGQIIEHMSIQDLLSQLNSEKFIFDVVQSLSSQPDLDNYQLTSWDEHNLEVELRREDNLNDLFACFQREGIEISSMRSKVNRLEELFVRLLATKKAESDNGN